MKISNLSMIVQIKRFSSLIGRSFARNLLVHFNIAQSGCYQRGSDGSESSGNRL